MSYNGEIDKLNTVVDTLSSAIRRLKDYKQEPLDISQEIGSVKSRLTYANEQMQDAIDQADSTKSALEDVFDALDDLELKVRDR